MKTLILLLMITISQAEVVTCDCYMDTDAKVCNCSDGTTYITYFN